MSQNPTIRITERRRFIAARTAELQAELETLQTEERDLETAERVWNQFSGPQTVGGNILKPSPATPSESPPDEEDGDSEGLTLPKMVFIILEEAKAAGKKGVEGSDIVMAVKTRWKPEFTAENIRPTLWRMVNRGRLRKRGKSYYLPISSPEGETEAGGASARH
ncbi:MAG TPA: hypothetical protein VIJ72_05420 [Rhizomicrobium sp.]